MNQESSPPLARHLGLFAVIVYGIGDMVGAGIYGTIGVAAGAMGNAVWMAFVVAMFAALFTGLSYASLASRYPRAAGAAFVTQKAYRSSFLSFVVGLAIVASGLTSIATGSRVFGEFLSPYLNGFPPLTLSLFFIVVLGAVNLRGIRECVAMNVVCTAIEVGGLLFVIFVGAKFWGSVNYMEIPQHAGAGAPVVVLTGAVLVFFAFVGFEDLINLSEETKNPTRTMPWGIVIALLAVTLLYIAISVTAVSVVNYKALGDASKGAPLAQITAVASPWLPAWIYPFISLFAVANTALVNYIMASRMIYGMSNQQLLPRWLGAVHPKTKTPYVAILVLMGVITLLILAGDVKALASATSLILLACFLVVNIALFILQRRPAEPHGAFEIPSFVPLAGAVICIGLIGNRISSSAFAQSSVIIAGSVLLVISALFFVLRPKINDATMKNL